MPEKIRQKVEDEDLLMLLAEMDLFRERIEKGEKQVNKEIKKVAEPLIDEVKILHAKRSKLKNKFFSSMAEIYEIDDDLPLKYIKEINSEGLEEYFIVNQTKNDQIPDNIKFLKSLFRKFMDIQNGEGDIDPDNIFGDEDPDDPDDPEDEEKY